MEESKITYISVDKLHPHPDNPRKDIGDITELADSIRQSGIYQNLTVIPSTGYYYGDYTVIIGHRRLAAAKAAGLTEVPCVITEMSKKEQLATMLLENMQRSDLTILEQAQGMQMMLDLGETIADISQKTGFSESTVKRRVRLCKLDKDKLEKAQGRQVAMADYDRLFEIEDADKRNEVLDSIGTNNFEWALRNAKSDIKREKTFKELIALLKQYYPEAEEIKNTTVRKYVTDISDEDKIKSLNLTSKIYYRKYSYTNSLEIYRDYTAEELERQDKKRIKESERENKRIEIVERCEDVYNNARELRKEFWRTFNQGNFRNVQSAISQMTVRAMFALCNSWNSCVLLDSEIYGDVTDSEFDSPLEISDIKGINGAAKLAYVILESQADDAATYDYYGAYERNIDLEHLYNDMAELGYEISDEELAMLDGTHDMYFREEQNND